MALTHVYFGMETDLLVILGCLVAVICIYYKRTRTGKYSHLPLPPGPKRLPFLGNVFNMPSVPEWEGYHKWAKEFDTDIIYLNIAGQDMVVLDTFEAASELLDRRSSIYSGRPYSHMMDIMGWGNMIAALDYGDKWRLQRSMMHQTFQSVPAIRFRPHSLAAARNVLNRFLEYPNDPVENIRHMTAEVILHVIYGIEIKPKNDPFVAIAEHGEEGFLAVAVPGAFLVESIPILKYLPEWVPGAGFKKKAREWRDSATLMREVPYKAATDMRASGASKHSFVSFTLDQMDEGKNLEEEEALRQVAFATYGAGTDTTLAAITSCIIALLEYPDVLRKAQAELDSVVQPGHLPDFEDQDSLPYITALAMEALRWRDALPLGLAHTLTTEDEYRGYRIPAGTLVVPNQWVMLHDEEFYPDPFTFNPDRFLKDGKLNKDVRDPSHACWGFGRRICPGQYVAFSSIWITLASMIFVFDIKKAIDDDGNVVEPTPEYITTLIYLPKPFRCSITPRSEEAKRLIRAYTNSEF